MAKKERVVMIVAREYWDNHARAYIIRGTGSLSLVLPGKPYHHSYHRFRPLLVAKRMKQFQQQQCHQSSSSLTTTTTTTTTDASSRVVAAAERLLDTAFASSSSSRRKQRRQQQKKRWMMMSEHKIRMARSETCTSLTINAPKPKEKSNEKGNDDDEEEDIEPMFSHLPKAPADDTRTVWDLIFPNPYKNEPPPPNSMIHWPKTLTEWRIQLQQTWELYRWTWRGFTTSSRGFLVEDPLDIDNHNKPLLARKQQEEEDTLSNNNINPNDIMENVRQNAKFVRNEAASLGDTMKKTTGIATKEDLKQLVVDGMKLFSECVNEFMSGYRKGRDDEVEKMLTEYFQNLEVQANKPKRRKIKPRIRNRTRRIILQRYLRTMR
jgi:hypothetical protein